MERDLQGTGAKDSRALAEEESQCDRPNPVGSLNKISSLQHFMSPMTSQEGKPNKVLCDTMIPTSFQLISPFEAFEASQKTCFLRAPQQSFGINGKDVQQFAVHQNRANDARSTTISLPCIVSLKNPLFKVHGSSNSPNPTGSTVKYQSFEPGMVNNIREMLKPPTTSAQLTIFYAGTVNVFDDVPWDTAQEIMLKASEGSKMSIDGEHPAAEATSCSGLSKTLPLTSHTGNQLENGFVAGNGKVSTSQNEPLKIVRTCMGEATAASILPRAVPQARKASLARFLEKRKERVSKSMPYSKKSDAAVSSSK